MVLPKFLPPILFLGALVIICGLQAFLGIVSIISSDFKEADNIIQKMLCVVQKDLYPKTYRSSMKYVDSLTGVSAYEEIFLVFIKGLIIFQQEF